MTVWSLHEHSGINRDNTFFHGRYIDGVRANAPVHKRALQRAHNIDFADSAFPLDCMALALRLSPHG